jgi:hypothetical protein
MQESCLKFPLERDQVVRLEVNSYHPYFVTNTIYIRYINRQRHSIQIQ